MQANFAISHLGLERVLGSQEIMVGAVPRAPNALARWAVTLQHHTRLAHTVRLHCIADFGISFVILRSEHATSAPTIPLPIS